MKKNIFLVLLISLFTIYSINSFIGCSKKDDIITPGLNDDIPADPGTNPPAYMPGPLRPTSAIDTTPGNIDRIRINLGGLLDPVTNLPINYSSSNLTIVEDSIVQGILITSGGTTTLGIDLVFCIDVTGSMGTEITGVTNSVLAFIDTLRSKNLDVNCGVVAYADNNDTRIPESINGISNGNDPGAFVIVQYRELNNDLTQTGPIYTFINGLYASYLGYIGGDLPEGGFDALWYAYSNFSWRPGAQRIFIVITDAPSWGKYAPYGSGTTRSPWRTDSLAQVLSGHATVHVVSKSGLFSDSYNVSGKTKDNPVLGLGEYDMKYLAIAGSFVQNSITYYSDGTGGTWTPLPSNGYVNLTTLPISTVLASSSLVEFVTNQPHGTEKTVRIVVDLGGSNNGEVSVIKYY